MAKLTILDPGNEGAPTPFLRGILTRSLCNAGITFESAYSLASSIKEELEEQERLTTTELRKAVIKRLFDEAFSSEVIEQYSNPSPMPRSILITHKGEEPGTPFSLHQHTRSMLASGLLPQTATDITSQVFQYLHSCSISEVDSDALGRITCTALRTELGELAVQRYLTWTHFSRSEKPIHILIGGATGTGKSTIATEVAHRFGIVRTQSTDMLREVMRVMVPEPLLPTLHTSSFNAWRVQPRPSDQPITKPSSDEVVSGYLIQATEVSVSGNAIIQRASRENVSLVMEGIHIHPARMREITEDSDGIVVPLMLAVIKHKDLRKRIIGRGTDSVHRRAKRYLKSFDAIWALQNFLLDEADQQNIPIIHNDGQEETIEQVLLAINEALSPQYGTTEEALFPE
jgi:2-phosphoglycerate kinase